MMFRPNKLKTKLLLAMALMTGVSLPTYANTVITDVQINSLISQAIETHPLVKSAQAEREATAEGISAAKLNLLPTPSVTTSYNDNDDLVSELGIRQPLWTGGRLTANVNQAIFDDKAASENIYAQQNDVAKTTIEAWQTYIDSVAQQRVYLENLTQLRNFEQMMQRRVNQGVSARIELDLVTNRILQETNAYEAAREQQHIAEARLQQITGRPLPAGSEHNVPSLSKLVEQAKVASAGFERMAFSEASFYNPTVVRELFQIESAKQEVKAQNASKFPTVFAEYTHTFDHDNNEDDGRFFVGLNYQPGAGFSNFALTRASQARVKSLVQSKDAAQRGVMEDIQIQYQQFASAKSRELSLVSAVAGAQIVLESYQRQFIAGRKSWLEVLNAVRELSDYQIRLVQTRSNILGSFYKLQVDFSLMPWQQRFSQNRQPVKMFNAIDPVKDWMNKQPKTVNTSRFGYGQADNSGYNSGGYNTTNINTGGLNNLGSLGDYGDDDYVHIALPASVEQQLEDGSYIMIDDQGQPVVVQPDAVEVSSAPAVTVSEPTQVSVAQMAEDATAVDELRADEQDAVANAAVASSAKAAYDEQTSVVTVADESDYVEVVEPAPEPVFPGINKPKASFPEDEPAEVTNSEQLNSADLASKPDEWIETAPTNTTETDMLDDTVTDSVAGSEMPGDFVTVDSATTN
ncbi:TolC family protein [Psychrobacter sp. FDAARGOS_221]|uniref:TolC family protein n=1 Tax=Psychrobacter sp. FDAARGOS_221 TaxID=1975705 RepID=UPI000BB53B99|nr:TolC family protein [Psychrobacter sp. FDAARGOS_221]PNK61503.1 TolC family protein [Psychrobacter sp. FDAARGOS_221]